MAKKPSLKLITPAHKPTTLQRLRGNFLTGLVVVAPVTLTIWVVWSAITFIDSRVVPLVPKYYNPSTYLGIDIAGFGVVIFLLFTAFVGAMTKGLFGRQLLRWGEGLLARTPVVRSIYNAVKQIFETVLSSTNNSFQDPCLIEYPRKGIWAIGFVATGVKGEVATKLGGVEMLSVFLPTTPNPTSGFLLFVPKKDVTLLNMSIEDAAKLVISAGLVVPDPNKPARVKTLAGAGPGDAGK